MVYFKNIEHKSLDILHISRFDFTVKPILTATQEKKL